MWRRSGYDCRGRHSRTVLRILGIRRVNLGQYLARRQSDRSNQSLNPIYVNIGVPQQQPSTSMSAEAAPHHGRH